MEIKKLIHIPEQHWAIYEEWLAKVQPPLEFSSYGSHGKWLPVTGAPLGTDGAIYRLAEPDIAPKPDKEHLTATDQYWYKKGYQQALVDVRAQLDVMAGKR